eukprot:scaffold2015_cov186-Amphora_coffeaeformis.AAC.6
MRFCTSKHASASLLLCLYLATTHKCTAFTPFRTTVSTKSSIHTHTEIASASITLAETPGVAKRKSLDHKRQPQHANANRRQAKFTIRKGEQGPTQVKTPVYDVEGPVSQRRNHIKSEQLNAIGLKPSELLSWSSMMEGMNVSGKVVKVLSYGVLVQTKYDIPSGKSPGVALLQFRNMPDNIKSELEVGTWVDNARVMKVNRKRGTVNISLDADKRDDVSADLEIGQEVNAKVVRIVPYGAFVDIGLPNKRQALLHVSRMSMYKVHDITDHVQLGEQIKARVIHLSGDGDIGLSILSEENDAFVDRRQLQTRRMTLWRQVVQAGVDEKEESTEQAKQELLEIDQQLWDLLSDYMDTPRALEV